MAVKRKEMRKPKEVSKIDVKKYNGIENLGWGLLLLGGLAQMMPTQMAPVLTWSVLGVTVQMAVGVLSVVMALYFLLGE